MERNDNSRRLIIRDYTLYWLHYADGQVVDKQDKKDLETMV